MAQCFEKLSFQHFQSKQKRSDIPEYFFYTVSFQYFCAEFCKVNVNSIGKKAVSSCSASIQWKALPFLTKSRGKKSNIFFLTFTVGRQKTMCCHPWKVSVAAIKKRTFSENNNFRTEKMLSSPKGSFLSWELQRQPILL